MESSLAATLLATQSTQKNERDAAENSFNEEWRTNPSVLFPCLSSLIRTGSNEVQIIAAVFFRRSIFTKSLLGWRTIKDEEKIFCKENILAALMEQSVPQIRRKISDAVAELSSYIYRNGESWPELLQFISSSITSNSPGHREIAYRLTSYAPSLLSSVPPNVVKNMFESGLQDSDIAVRLECLSSFLSFYVQCASSVRKVLNEILPYIAQTLESLKVDEAVLLEGISALNDFIPKTKSPLKTLYPAIMPVLEAFIKNADLEIDIRYGALEAVVGMVEMQPNLIKTADPSFSERILPVLFQFFQCLEDDQQWYSSSNDDDDDPDTEHVVALQALDRLSRALGGEVILPVSFSIISSFLESSMWQERFGALMSIAYLSEGSADLLETKIDLVIKCIYGKIRDDHVRVRWAVAHCIGQLCEDISVEAMEPYRNTVLEMILLLMNDQHPRALVDCCSFCEKESLLPYLDSLVERLLTLLQTGRPFVQEQVITSLEYLSSTVGDEFIKYYNVMVPLMMEIMKNAVQDEYRMMRVKAMECIGCVGVSVGKDVFLQFATEFLNYVISIQQTVSGPEDPIVLYLNTTWLNICLTIKHDFTQYLPLVMPNLLVTASKVPEIVVADEDEDTDAKYGEGWDAITFDHKKIVIHSSVMEDKNSALSLILSFAEELEEDFLPYVEQVFEITFVSLQNRYSDSVRNTCSRLVPVLLNCLIKSNTEREKMQAILEKCVGEFITSIKSFEKDFEFVYTAIDALNDCFEILKDFQIIQIEEIFKLLSELVGRYYRSSLQKMKEEDEIVDTFVEEAVSEDEILESIPRLVHTLFSHYGASTLYGVFTSSFETSINLLLSDCASVDFPSARAVLLHFWCDIVEFCPQESLAWLPNFADFVTLCMKSEDGDVRRAACFGVGLCALTKLDAYADFVSKSLPTLFEACSIPNAKDPDHIYATENAVSTIGKILAVFSSKAAANESLDLHGNWVGLLPITFDDDEFEFTYSYLMSWASQNIGVLPLELKLKIIQVLFHAFAHKKVPDSVLNMGKTVLPVLLGSINDQSKIMEIKMKLRESQRKRLSSLGII